MNVINLNDVRKDRNWKGKLKPGPILIGKTNRLSKKMIDLSNLDLVVNTERQMIHDIAEFIYDEGLFRVTHEKVILEDLGGSSARLECRDIEVSVMIFRGNHETNQR